jgi:DNA-binding protein HU-beta
MNKTELINAMSVKAGLSKKDTQKALDAFMDVTKQALKKEQRLSLPGFITFKVVDRPARTARNVHTGAKINVPAKKVVKFRVGNNLADAVK